MPPLTEAALRRALEPAALVGRELRCLPEVTSTNDLLKALARQGAPEGLVLLAERQTAGRGRLGRNFQSPAGKGLWLSLLLRPQCPPERLPQVTALTAVAVRRAILAACGLETGIKWPNDLVWQGRKLCGILTELETGGDGLALVIGIGLNVSQQPEDFPPELRPTAVSLTQALGREIPREPLAAALLRRLDAMYRDLLSGDLASWRQDYRAACVTLGREVRVLRPEGERRAFARDVDAAFGLTVDYPGGTGETLRSGEVSVRGLAAYAEGAAP